MADRLKDKQAPGLEAMFRSDPLPDLGFSKKVMARVRRQVWIRRLTMPAALIIGGSIAIKPASDIVIAMTQVFDTLPPKLTDAAVDFSGLSVSSLPHSATILVSGVIALVALGLVRALED
ncbi:MAG: hypothetical protein GXP15_02620 [Gammaproteobacteria bacterium]|nr:hypothetical protein [Gammaproteobacteria bacterium]